MAHEYIFPQGGTNPTVYLVLVDQNGDVVTGLTSASAGASLDYLRPLDASPTSVTLSDLSNEDSAHSDGGMIEVASMPGLYRFDLPDAAIARGENFVLVNVKFDATAQIYAILLLDPLPSVPQGEVNDASATATSFVTTLPGGEDDVYNDAFLAAPTLGWVRLITDWVDSSKTITIEAAPSAPADTTPLLVIER